MEFSNSERPNNPESSRKDEIKALFKDYGELAIIHGEIDERPLAPGLTPKDDGTIDTDGTSKRPFELQIAGRKVPDILQDHGIDELKVSYQPSVILKGKPTKETVLIYYHEGTGIDKYIRLQRGEDKEEITPQVIHRVSEKEEEPRTGLTYEQRKEIARAVLGGDQDLIREEGPVGEYARGVYGVFREPSLELDQETITLFREALPAIKAAAQ